MSDLELRPIHLVVLRNSNSFDQRQEPAAGARIAATRAGATVTAAASCTATQDATVSYAGLGRILPGDLVTKGATEQLLFVRAVDPGQRTLTVRNVTPGGATINLVANDRLVLLPQARSAVVGQGLTISPAPAVAGVTITGPQVGTTLTVHGEPGWQLIVNAVAANGASATLTAQGSRDLRLQAGQWLIDDVGHAVMTITADVVCAHGVGTSVPMVTCSIPPGTLLYPGLDLASPLVVAGFDAANGTLSLENPMGHPVTLDAGDRLLARAGVELFADPCGALALEHDLATLDERGRATVYARESRVDLVAFEGGLPAPVLLPDRMGGWARGGSTVFNALDYPSIQDAIDALPPEGGTVFIPAGTYVLTETLYTPCAVPCHLVGEASSPDLAIGSTYQGTTLVWNTPVDMLRVRGNYSSVRQLTLRNTASPPAQMPEDQGRGLTIGRRAIPDRHPRAGELPSATEYEKYGHTPQIKVLIEDVTIIGSPGWGIHIPGYGVTSDGQTPEPGASVPGGEQGGTLSFWIDCKRVRVVGCKKHGGCFVGGGCTTTYFENCSFERMGRGQASTDGAFYAYLSGCEQAVFERCTFEGVSPTALPWIRMRGSVDCGIHTCWFENDPISEGDPNIPTYFVHLTGGCRGGAIRDCHMVRGFRGKGYLKLIQLDANGARGLLISNPHALSVDASTHFVAGEERYVDELHVDLGGDTNTEIHVVGAGVYQDSVRSDPATDHPPSILPIQIANVPKRSTIQGTLVTKVPVGVYAELGPPTTPPNGNLMMATDLPGAGSLSYYRAGTPGDWRLANNAPTLVPTERDARSAWTAGDMILCGPMKAIQVRQGGAWQLANNLPALSVVIRDSDSAWTDGDGVLNTDIGAPQLFVEGYWRLANNVPTLTPEDRDAQTWIAGDVLATTDVNAAQMRTGTGWRLLNNAPPLTTAQRDLRFDWANGDPILNTTLNKLQIRVGGAWKSISYS